MDQDSKLLSEAYSKVHKKKFSLEDATKLGEKLGINWETNKFDAEQFKMGLESELEHGTKGKDLNITNDNPLMTAKIALAHLREISNYYDRLKKMEG